MRHVVHQLEAGDYDEAMTHLSLVFGDHDFAGLLPALYQPDDEHMARNYAIRCDGRIAAVAGLFPIDWVVGEQTLSVAGVGGVSVNPAYRGRGLMRRLMDEVVAEIRRGRYHAAYLGGNRWRYAPWGFEKAGTEARYVISPHGAAHRVKSHALPAFRLADVHDDDVAVLMALYQRSPIRCRRDAGAFLRHLRNWRHVPLVLRDASGRSAAYACLSPGTLACVEWCAESGDAMDGLASCLIERYGKPVSVAIPQLRTPISDRLCEVADDVSIMESGNWLVLDWPRLLRALLRAKHAAEGLVAGSCVVKVRGMGAGLRLVADDVPHCELTEDGPDWQTDAATLLRTLTGPLPVKVPDAAAILQCWRPLPLMIPMQDRV